MAVDKGMKVLEIFARDWRELPFSFSLLLIFGVVFVMSMLVGAREPLSVVVMSVTLLAAYLAVLLPRRRLFALSADARRLRKFMELRGSVSGIRFCIATFKDTEAKEIYGGSFTYSSHASSDVAAMIELVALLAKHGLVEETRNPLELLIKDDDPANLTVETIVNVGGPRVSGFVQSLVHEDRIVSYEYGEEGAEIAITVAGGLDRRYSMRPPSHVTKRTDDDTFREETYGCVMKRAGVQPTRFAVWGLDARGTLAAAHWLARNWSQLETRYSIENGASFTAILRVPAQAYYADNPIRVEYSGAYPLLLPTDKHAGGARDESRGNPEHRVTDGGRD